MDKHGNISESFKKSKGGRLKLVQIDGTYKTVNIDDFPTIKDELMTVFENGELLKEWTFEEVKENIKLRI